MPFEPVSEAHAVVEVVFGLDMTRSFSRKEIDALSDAHDQWKDWLPRKAREQIIGLAVGSLSQTVEPGVGGVRFERTKPDGSTEWRFSVSGQRVSVNCLAYTRWKEISDKALNLMAEAVRISAGPSSHVANVFLQYIDRFQWRGRDADYRIGELLNLGDDWLPSSLSRRGKVWHMHQGWFKSEDIPVDGRALERIHIDGILVGQTVPTVQIDTYIRVDPIESLSASALFESEGVEIRRIFDELHRESKRLLNAVLVEEAARRIGLNAHA